MAEQTPTGNGNGATDPVVALVESAVAALWAQREQLASIADALTVLASPPRAHVELENILEESARRAAQDRLTARSNTLNQRATR